VALLSLLAKLLLAGKVQAQCEGGLVDLLHDLGVEVLAGALLSSQVEGDAGLYRVNLLDLALVHHLTRQALGGELP